MFILETIKEMFSLQPNKKIILASNSPRRKEFLTRLGIPFETIPALIDETVQEGEGPEAFVSRMAHAKASVVSDLYPDSWIIGADTVIDFGGDILGKPEDENHALSMLTRLAGHSHKVITGYTLICNGISLQLTRTSVTKVWFHKYPQKILKAYVRTGEPLDKAGSYGIQGIGSFLVKKISGSYSNVVGLPISDLILDLLKYEVVEPQNKMYG